MDRLPTDPAWFPAVTKFEYRRQEIKWSGDGDAHNTSHHKEGGSEVGEMHFDGFGVDWDVQLWFLV